MARNIVFALDVEPDPIRYGPDETWEGTAVTLRELSALRNRVQQRTGLPFRLNWFARFDPHMERAWGPDWVPQAWLLNTVCGHGDFIGVQVHLWKWQESQGGWFSDTANPNWRTECLESSIDGYRALLGAQPSASRFGDRVLLEEDIPPLKQSGIHYDMTLEPAPVADIHSPAAATGHLLDPQSVPRKPYRPSTQGLAVNGTNGAAKEDFWLVPLTLTRRSEWVRVQGPPFFRRTKLPLNLVVRPRSVWAQLAAEIDKDTAEPIVFVVRSGSLADPFLLANFRIVTDNLARHSRLNNCRFVGVDQAIAAYAKSQEAEAPRHY